MENSKTLQEKYKKAKKRVVRIKGFYKHLTAYLIINTVIICLKTYFMDFVEIKGVGDENFLNWLDWNIISTPLLWGIGLLIHGICVFRFKFGFVQKWEERQIRKYMENDSSTYDEFK